MPTTEGPTDQDGVARRASELFEAHRRDVSRRTDRLFAGLMGLQWLVAVAVALLISPQSWAGASSQTHIHVWAAVFLGGAIVSLPIALALARPGMSSTRKAVAIGQMLMGSLLIHLSGGRIETHFHVFGSLALLAVIAVTAHAIKGEDEAILASGVSALVTKPIDEALLLRTIRSFLGEDSRHG